MRRDLLALLGCLAACGARSGLDAGELELGASGGAGATTFGGKAGSQAVGGSSAGKATGGTGVGGGFTGGTGGMPIGGSVGEAGDAGEGPCPNGPRDEKCNGLDDDCDGQVDEDLPLNVAKGPVAVRVDEGSTDEGNDVPCISCSWAWRPQVVAPDGQLGVVWYLGISGGAEQPSGFYRRLSWDLEPQGQVGSLGPQYWMNTLRRGGTGPRGTLVTFTERVDHQDLPSYGFITSDFEASASTPLRACGNGSQGLVMVTSLFSGVVACGKGNVLHVLSTDQKGNVATASKYVLEIPGATAQLAGRPVAVHDGTRGLLAVPLATSANTAAAQLWTVEISADGAPIAEPRLQTSAALIEKELYLEGLFADEQGYVLFGDHRFFSDTWPGGRFVARLDTHGTPNDVGYYDDSTLRGFSDVAVLQVDKSFVVAETTPSGLALVQVGKNGLDVLSENHFDVVASTEASLLYEHGHLFAAYAEEPELKDLPNRVAAIRLSCQ